MNSEDLISGYSPVGDIISIVVCLILLFVIAEALYLSNSKRFIFLKRAVHFVLLAACSNVGLYHVVRRFGNVPMAIILLRDIYHFALICCLYCFLVYVKRMLDVKDKFVIATTYFTRIFFCVCLVLDLLSPLTKIGLHLENGNWQDSLLSPYNAFYAYTVLMMAGMLIFYSDRVIRSVRTCLIATELVIILIMVYQAYMNINTFSSFTYLLPIMIVLLTLHSKPFDVKTGSLDKGSFESFLKQMSKQGQSVDYLVLKLYLSMIDQIPNELGKVLSSFWRNAFKEALLFEMSSDLYVLAIPRRNKNGDSERKIRDLVDNYFQGYYEQYQLTYKIAELFDIDFLDSVSDILGILRYLFNNMEDNSTFILDEKKREDLKLFKQVRWQLADIEKKEDMDDPRVLVYCQPIRNMKTGKFDTAEALMRLSLPDYGFIMPSMFIGLAEEYNHIHALSKVLLNKVCKEIKRLEEEGYSFERISVNFAASEIKQEGFCDEIIAAIKKHGINPSKIGIELTESQTEQDFKIVKSKIKILRDAGITLYLDDVGTGYSNLDRIVQYDVDVVKFDRFFLLEAEKSIKIVKMISHLSQAFRDLDYIILYEGVETENHEKLCLTCGADYIQGYKYSKPLPIEEMRKFFESGDNQDETNVITNTIYPEFEEKRDFTFEELKNQYGILLTMSKLFYSMHVIDLINNTAKPYNPTEDVDVVDVVNSQIGADEMMRRIMRMCTVDKDVDAVLAFSDLTTIAERMKGKRIFQSDPYGGKTIGLYVAAFYTIEADDEGRPTKVVYTTRSIADELKK